MNEKLITFKTISHAYAARIFLCILSYNNDASQFQFSLNFAYVRLQSLHEEITAIIPRERGREVVVFSAMNLG